MCDLSAPRQFLVERKPRSPPAPHGPFVSLHCLSCQKLCQMRDRASLSCAQPGRLRGSSSLPAAPTLTHSLKVGVKFFGALSPIIQLSNQNICIFMFLYDNSFRTPQVINLDFLENKLLEIKQLLLQIK